jgi:hypothetical protein
MGHIYSVLKATEGGMGQREAIRLLREAGIRAMPTTSVYVGHTAVVVMGNKRVQQRATRILFGR